MKLAEKIEHDLKRRIVDGIGLPEPLTLNAISREYRVSVMPARGAVNQLIEKGFVIKNANGRLAVNPNLPEKLVNSSERANRFVDRFPEVRNEVIWRSLRGEPRYLRIASLADRYSVGRTKAQGYLHRLSNEGLLVHHQRRGWQIRPFRKDDLDAFLNTRVALELMAFDQAIGKFDQDYVTELYQSNRLGDQDCDACLDDRLHGYWIGLADNRYLREFFDRSGRFFDTLYHSARIDQRLANRLVKQHHCILEAVQEGGWGEAREALADDIRSLKPILESSAERMSQAGDPGEMPVFEYSDCKLQS